MGSKHSDVMWQDEIERAVVCHRSTQRKVSRKIIMSRFAFAPVSPFLHFFLQRPPASRLSNI